MRRGRGRSQMDHQYHNYHYNQQYGNWNPGYPSPPQYNRAAYEPPQQLPRSYDYPVDDGRLESVPFSPQSLQGALSKEAEENEIEYYTGKVERTMKNVSDLC